MSSFDDEFKLASLDFMGDTRELEEKALAAVAAAGPDYRVPQRLEGADASGQIRVIVDPEGQVLDVEISPRWREQVPPAEFGSALYLAYVAAQGKAVEATTLAALVAEQNKSEDDREWDRRRVRADIEDSLSYVPAEDEREWLRQTWDKLYEIDDRLHRTARGVLAEGEEKRAHSPYGYFVFTYSDQTVTGISGDVERIRNGEPGQLRTEALAAFRSVRYGVDE